MHQPLKLYRASAGAGKTHKLTEEFLKLLFQYPDNYRQILAVTFTKKATGEMKSRILEELNKLAKGKKAAHFKIIKELDKYKAASDDKIQQTAQLILKKILHDFSHFSITTIDSFFQKILTSFFKEIGMHSGYSIEMDHDVVIDYVIDQLLHELGENKPLKQWLIKFSKEKMEDGRSWDIEKELKKLSKEIFKEEFKAKEKEIRRALHDKDSVEQFQKKLFVIKETFEKQQREIGEKGMKQIEKYQLTLDDFSNKQKGVASSFFKMSKNEFDSTKPTVQKAIDNIDAWFTKASTVPKGLQQQVFADLNSILKEAIEVYDREIIKYNSSCEVLRYYNQFGLLAEISRKLQEYRENEHKLLISDVAGLLKQITGENDTSFVFEKTASWYKHFIIDEFQDTSLFQWDNFKPLIENSLAEGNNLNMIVGDVKQSIYRWRGGNWSLIHNCIEKEINEVEALYLNENWRSGVNVIQFNNFLFKQAPSILQQHLNYLLPEEVSIKKEELIKQVYADSAQFFPSQKKDHGGYVQVKFYNNKDEVDGKWQEQVKKNVVVQIYSFMELGYRLKDMAILVRDNKEAKEMADVLLQHSIDVISSESLSLHNSIAVKIIMGIIQFLNEPSDTITMAMLQYEYAHYHQSLNVMNLHELFSSAKEQHNKELQNLIANKEQQAYFKTLSLYELIEELVQRLHLIAKKEELPYLQAFQDAVLSYSRNRKADLGSFLEWWNEYGKKKTVFISEDQNAVQIMTIHKSKGLSFKIVFMPFVNWKLDTDSKKENILWVQTSEQPFAQFPYLPIKYSKDLAQTYFSSAYYKEMLNGYIDNLNLLYVACTRAVDAMVISAPKPTQKDDKVTTVADLLYTVLAINSIPKTEEEFNHTQYWNSEDNRFEVGEIKPTEKEQTESHQLTLNSYHSYPWRNRITIRRHAKDYFLPLSDQNIHKVNYGTLMHEVLKNIQRNEELTNVLESLYLQGKIVTDQKLHLHTVIENFLKLSEVQDWFSDKWEIKNERAVLLGSGKIKIPDKVLIKGDHAVVIDFKTGRESKEYEKQIKEYIGILQKMGYKNVKGFLAYIEESKIIAV